MRWVAAVVVLLASSATSAVTTVEAASAHGECTHRSVMSRVKGFAADFSHGRLQRADAVWAGRREFQWYSTTGPGARLNSDAMNRRSLRAYFRQRIVQRERLRVTQLRSFYEARRNIRHFHGQLVRRARDLRPTVFRFKGALSCRTRKLIVWSMASGEV